MSFAGSTVTNQGFVVVTSASAGVIAAGYSGILGASFGSLSVTQSPTVIETMLAENKLARCARLSEVPR